MSSCKGIALSNNLRLRLCFTGIALVVCSSIAIQLVHVAMQRNCTAQQSETETVLFWTMCCLGSMFTSQPNKLRHILKFVF